MSDTWDLAIVGAGAAGLAASIFAAQGPHAAGKRVVLIDSARKIGAKILVSGGGRCNVTNVQVRPDDFQGSRNIVRNILASFNETRTVQWMKELGVELKTEETGKLFPITDSARTVLDALQKRSITSGVLLLTNSKVIDVVAGAEGFLIRLPDQTIQARRLIFATGGKSLPLTGSDGSGWEIVRRLGHTVTATYPSLVPLLLDARFFHAAVSGLSHEAELTTLLDGRVIDRRTGSLLWTHFGISGPVAMDASRFFTMNQNAGQPLVVRCSILPGENLESLEKWMMQALASRPNLSLRRLVSEKLPERLADAILEYSKIDSYTPLSHLPKETRRKTIQSLIALDLPILRDRGWNYAEVTAGGVPLNEIDPKTMQSRRVPGLFLAGELLDCDGRIGGFNFQWAWATGFLAGSHAFDEPRS